MTKAEERALEAYPVNINDHSVEKGFDWNEEYRDVFIQGYEQALKDIGIVNELIDQKGVAIVDTIDNYSGHQTINTIRFVGEDKDKPKPLSCKYYHVWLKAAKEEEL